MLDRGLPCLDCGYDLRGQSGDPVRCPECGVVNRLADLLVNDERIRRRLRRMETGPALCVASITLVGGWHLPLEFAAAIMHWPIWAWSVVYLCSAAAALGWIAGFSMFRSASRGCPRWFVALIAFHIYGLAVATICAFAFYFLTSMIYEWSGVPVSLLLYNLDMIANHFWIPIDTAAPFLATVLLIPWLRRRAKRAIEPLQRRVAVELVGELNSEE